MKKNITLILLIILIILGCVYKQYLVYKLPVLVNAGAMEDDELLVYHAHTILNNEWLGEYKYNTLIKNPGFSFFLVLSNKLNISYINSVTFLYSISCILIILSIAPKIKNKAILGIIFILLLFNPITYSIESFQRVYRNSIIPALSLMVISSFIGMFLYRDKKVFMILWSIIACFSLPMFYYTREDSIWIVPLIILFIISTSIAIILEKKLVNYIKIILLIIPIICTSIFGSFISNMNYKYYGDKIINTQQNSKFAEAMALIETIKPKERIRYYNNTKEKLNRIAEVSPSFNSIKVELDKTVDHFQNKEAKEVADGLFGWAVILAAYNSGYTTLEQENELYSKITEELKSAINNNLLETQKLMPLMGGRALEKNEYPEFFKKIIDTFLFVGNYKLVRTVSAIESPYYPGLNFYYDYFREITKNRAIVPSDAKDTSDNFLLEVSDQKEYIESITPQIKTLEKITNIYYYIAIIIEILGLLSYLILFIYTIISIIHKKFNSIENFIISSSLIGTVFTLIVGVAFVDYTKTRAITNLHLVGAYSIFILFSLVSIYSISKVLLNCFANNNSKH